MSGESGDRNKTRFGMYLTFSSSISLWISSITFDGIEWRDVLLDPLVGEVPTIFFTEIGFFTFFIATILYQLRPDERVDKWLRAKIIIDSKRSLSQITILFLPSISPSWISVEDESEDVINQLFEREYVQKPLWEFKLGVFTALAIVFAILRVSVISSVLFLIYGLITGISILWTSFRRREWRELPEKMMYLTVFNFFTVEFESSAQFIEEMISICDEAEVISSRLKYIQKDDEFKKIDKAINSGSWSLAKRKINHLIKTIRNILRMEHTVGYLDVSLSNLFVIALSDLHSGQRWPTSEEHSSTSQFMRTILSILESYLEEAQLLLLKRWLASKDRKHTGSLLRSVDFTRLENKSLLAFESFLHQCSWYSLTHILGELKQHELSTGLCQIFFNIAQRRVFASKQYPTEYDWLNYTHSEFPLMEFTLLKCKDQLEYERLSHSYKLALLSYAVFHHNDEKQVGHYPEEYRLIESSMKDMLEKVLHDPAITPVHHAQDFARYSSFLRPKDITRLYNDIKQACLSGFSDSMNILLALGKQDYYKLHEDNDIKELLNRNFVTFIAEVLSYLDHLFFIESPSDRDLNSVGKLIAIAKSSFLDSENVQWFLHISKQLKQKKEPIIFCAVHLDILESTDEIQPVFNEWCESLSQKNEREPLTERDLHSIYRIIEQIPQEMWTFAPTLHSNIQKMGEQIQLQRKVDKMAKKWKRADLENQER